MGVAFASIFLTHFSTSATRLAAVNLEQARSEVKEVQMNQALEREREKFRADLARMNRILIIETMSTTLTHEISQPINSTSVFIGAIRRWLGGPSANVAEALNAAEKASRQIDRAREIVESIRGFARKGSQDQTLIDLVECVDEVLILMQKEFTFHGIQIDFERPCPSRSIDVIALRHEVQQIIANLLLNSIEAFTDTVRDRGIKIRFLISNFGVDLQITDNGEGISSDVESELFSKFVTTKENGTGLGLSISMELAEKFGGQLDLKAGPQGGAIATLHLPLAPKATSRDSNSMARTP